MGREEGPSVCMRLGGVGGACNSCRTSEGIGFKVRGNGLVNLLKPDKDKGAAVLQVVTNLRAPSDKRIVVSKGIMGSIPTDRHKVKFMFRGCTLFHCVAICSGITFNLGIRGTSGGGVSTEIERLVGLMKLRKLRGECPDRLSNNREREITFTETLTPGPRILLLSRPFTTVSTGVHRRLQD